MAFSFVDLFAGLGGFHLALARLGGSCTFACEIDTVLQDAYEANFGLRPCGDIRLIQPTSVPRHQVLCAGFPCQPFSKAGDQMGVRCPRWGDLFKYVSDILRVRQPDFFILENVPNLLRHDGTRTWEAMKAELASCGYGTNVQAQILSPHWFGIPQIRERAYIVGAREGLDHFSWPNGDRATITSIRKLLDKRPRDAKQISAKLVEVLDVWQEFISQFSPDEELPSFPIWAMEFGATYPFEKNTPLAISDRSLGRYRGAFGIDLGKIRPGDRRDFLPRYSLTADQEFPEWKKRFIRQNRELYRKHRGWITPWLRKLRNFPPSHQKLEWNCKGGKRNIWDYVIQFRASGVRVKRPSSSPSLIAMTTTQVPIIGWERRYLTPRECAKIQCLGALEHLPQANTHAYKALGNAVNSEVVEMIAEKLLAPIIAESTNTIRPSNDSKKIRKSRQGGRCLAP